MPRPPGLFIAFEGVDGSGKTTQTVRLARALEARGQSVLVTREPGGTMLGEALRELILSPATGEIGVEAELCLFMGARAEHARAVIEPALASGRVVLCDRYLGSSVVYQGIVGGLGADRVLELGRWITRGVLPRRTIWIDIDPRSAHGALDARDRVEKRGLSFQLALRDGFRELHARRPTEITRVDGSGSVDEVASRVEEALRDLLPVFTASGQSPDEASGPASEPSSGPASH